MAKEHDDHKKAVAELAAAANSAGFTDLGKAAAAHGAAADKATNALNSGSELEQLNATIAMVDSFKSLLVTGKNAYPVPAYLNQLSRDVIRKWGLAISVSA